MHEQAVITTRQDLKLIMTDVEAGEGELSCPIHVFGGSEDPIISESDLQQWRSRTKADFSVQMLRGGHFYLRDKKPLFETLRPLMSMVSAAFSTSETAKKVRGGQLGTGPAARLRVEGHT